MIYDPNTPTPEEVDLVNQELDIDGEPSVTADQVTEIREQMPDEEED